MLKNVAGIWFHGKPSESEWDVRVVDLGGGHKEAVISRPTVWEEVDAEESKRLNRVWEEPLSLEQLAELEERKQANVKRAARRAKTRVRRICKVAGLDALLTLTYRANQTDLALCKKHFEQFVRRIKRVVPGFVYVSAFERQKRGAWHVHMAIHALPRELSAVNGVKVKSFNIVRSIWRSVVGDLDGNIDQQRRKWTSRQSVGRLASYLSKYMLKAFEDGDDWSNRYSASKGIEVPRPDVMRFTGSSLAELMGLVYDAIAGGRVEVVSWLNHFKDLFYLSIEPCSPS